MPEQDTQFAGVEAHFRHRSESIQLDHYMASLAKDVRQKLLKAAKDSVERCRQSVPEVKWNEPDETVLVTNFIEYLNGKTFHDPDENK